MLTKHQKKELNGLLHQILELRDGKCLRCGKPEFQMSHIYPKGRYKKLEFDPDNLKALCFACHLGWWHKNPIEAMEWLPTVIKPERLARLKLRAQSSGAGMQTYSLLKIMLQAELQKYVKSSSNNP